MMSGKLIGGIVNNNDTFKILSIDGGGIKGLYSAVILADFEEKYGRLNQHFNLICGTSTGGIIALAIASGIPAKEIVELYSVKGPLIFPNRNKLSSYLHKAKQAFFASKYDEVELKKALKEVFGDKRIIDCKTNVLIPVSNITTGQPFIIKNNHTDGLIRDDNHLLVDVALATTAAPTYFPIQEISSLEGEAQFTDGGLFANNPSLHGIQEAYKFFINKNGRSFNRFGLLSVSTLHQNFSYKSKLKVRRRSFLHWNSNLISLMLDLQSISTHYHIEYLNDTFRGDYLRINSESLNENESKLVDLDKAGKDSIDLLIRKGHKASEKWINDPQLCAFFKSENDRSEIYG